MKRSHCVIIVILFSVIWSTARIGILPSGLQAALQYEQLMFLDPARPSIAKSLQSRQMHHPFSNLTATHPPPEQPFRYSSFSCVQPVEEMNPSSIYPDFVGRTCQYKNVYYHPRRRTFHYFVSPAEEQLIYQLENNETLTSQEILQNKMTVSWSYIKTSHVKGRIVHNQVRPRFGGWRSFQWHPTLNFIGKTSSNSNGSLYHPVPPRWNELSWSSATAFHQPPKPVILLSHPSYSFNFGHFLLDDVATWFQMLQTFGHIQYDTTDSPVILPVMWETRLRDPLYRCSPRHAKWAECVGMYRRFVPQLLHVEWGEHVDILRTRNFLKQLPVLSSELIRLDEVIAGAGRMAHYSCDGSCSIGRVSWIPLFRRWLLRQLLLEHGPSSSSGSSMSRQLDRSVDTERDYITISLPFNSSRVAGLSYFTEIIEAAQARFGSQRVQVVILANMTLSEQAWLVLHSSVFVTYEGGGSHTSIFLPPGGTVVLYNSNAKLSHDVKVFYRDRTWYNTMTHVRKVWVSQEDRHNVTLAMNILEQYTSKGE